jgi:hypothetical protein
MPGGLPSRSCYKNYAIIYNVQFQYTATGTSCFMPYPVQFKHPKNIDKTHQANDGNPKKYHKMESHIKKLFLAPGL